MEVDCVMVNWITEYLTSRPQFVWLQSCQSVLESNTGAPQGTVLSPLLYTLYTSDFRFNSGPTLEVLRRLIYCWMYETVVASALFFVVVCWRGGIMAVDVNRLNKLVRMAGSVVRVSAWRRWLKG